MGNYNGKNVSHQQKAKIVKIIAEDGKIQKHTVSEVKL
jgi:hypothetical protein